MGWVGWPVMDDSARTSGPASDAGGRLRGAERRLLIWSGVVLAVAVAGALILSFAGETELDPGSPEGVTQEYLQLLISGDRTAARAHLSDELEECGKAFGGRYLAERAYRIEWLDTSVDGTRAWVTVAVTEAPRGIFSANDRITYRFGLATTSPTDSTGSTGSTGAAGWRITHQEWPWPECSVDWDLPEPGA